MGKILFDEGRLVIEPDENDHVALPETITRGLLQAIFDSEPGDPGHVDELHRMLTPADKQRFHGACISHGEEFERYHNRAALSWASILNDDSDWDPKALGVRWRRSVETSLVDEVFLADCGRWFVLNGNPNIDRRVLSTAEFELHYGIELHKHLRREAKVVTKRLEDLAVTVESPLVTVSVTVMKNGAIATYQRSGPAGVSAREWALESGETFINEEP